MLSHSYSKILLPPQDAAGLLMQAGLDFWYLLLSGLT